MKKVFNQELANRDCIVTLIWREIYHIDATFEYMSGGCMTSSDFVWDPLEETLSDLFRSFEEYIELCEDESY